jgi:hypothetical protein
VIHSFFSVAITRVSLSLCSLFEGLWWVNDLSPSFGSTAPSISSSTLCSSSSDFQLFYMIPIISIFPFWIRFFQVVLSGHQMIVLERFSSVCSVRAQMAGHTSLFWLGKYWKSRQCRQVLFLHRSCRCRRA